MTQSYRYQLADLHIISDIELSYAYKPIVIKEPDIVIKSMETLSEEYLKVIEAHKKGSCFIYRYSPDKAYYSYWGQGLFQVLGGNQIEYYLYDGYNNSQITQTILCQCFGALIAQRGMIGIHSGVCYIHNKSVIVCGDSGAGKTTLIAELLHRGAEFMADDTACISVDKENVSVHALVPLRKLCEDTLMRYPVPAARHIALSTLAQEDDFKIGIKEDDIFHLNPEPVGVMFLVKVQPIENVSVREVRGIEKFSILTENLYAPGAYRELIKSKDFFDKLAVICNNIPIYELVRPQYGMTIDQMADTIEEIVGKC